MTDFPENAIERRGEWMLTRGSLQRLLNWLDGGVGSDGQRYVEVASSDRRARPALPGDA